jgi:hypothetical protein
MLIQQGDVLLKKIESLPKNLKLVTKTARGFVLAEGEKTGHAHVIEADVKLYMDDDKNLFMSNVNPVTIKHEEHNHIEVDAGIWSVGIVQEYDHFLEESKNVAD